MTMHRRSELHKSGFGEHWRRQIGDVHPSAFARQIGGCEVRYFLLCPRNLAATIVWRVFHISV